MNTSIKNLIATTLTAVVLTTSAFAADPIANTNQITVLNNIKSFDKIKVSGNVELIIMQSDQGGVKVYDSYYSKNALVQQKNGELFVSSFSKEKLTVVAYVKNLSSIVATDNASVTTFGKVSMLALDIKLQSNATANLDVNVINLTTDVSHNASLILKGTAEALNASVEQMAKVNISSFKAESTNFSAKNSVAKMTPVSILEGLGK